VLNTEKKKLLWLAKETKEREKEKNRTWDDWKASDLRYSYIKAIQEHKNYAERLQEGKIDLKVKVDDILTARPYLACLLT
jgi:hypothetical protein